MITRFCSPMTTGTTESVAQFADEPRLVLNCKLKTKALVGHVNKTKGPKGTIVNCGSGTMVSLKTVPQPFVPPWEVVP